MATAPANIVRSLPAIALDIATTRSRQSSLYGRTQGREPDDDEDKLWSELDDRRDALENEFKTAFLLGTGLTWQMAWEVMA